MIVEMLGLMGAALAGAIAHEAAHWVVWQASGRRPVLDLWQLEVRPRAGPTRTTRWDRVAAAMPYVMGAGAITFGIYVGSLAAVAFGAFQFGIPSAVDVDAMLGRTLWRIDRA